jgi:hypothetical protein
MGESKHDELQGRRVVWFKSWVLGVFSETKQREDSIPCEGRFGVPERFEQIEKRRAVFSSFSLAVSSDSKELAP